MDAMPRAHGAAMSMMWTRMPGQSWAGAAAAFVAMWTVMMVAMMLPSFMPMLHRHRARLGGVDALRGLALTLVVALGYFAVWSALGAVVFPLGALLASAEQRLPALARVVPVATGVVVLIAGLVQLTEWKARHLVFDRDASARIGAISARVDTAFRHGVCVGIQCTYCCAGLTATLLALGVMDLRVMAVMTAGITAERLAPAGVRVARAVGVVGIVTGTLLIARAVGSG